VRFAKLSAMVVLTSIIAGILSWTAMKLTSSGRTEYLDYATMTVYAWWLAFFHLCIFMVPCTLALEPTTRSQRWPYLLIAVSVSFGWTLLLDGQTQLISYIFSIVIGLICGAIWAGLSELLQPWKKQNA
jgi:hypothetical protein